MFKNQLKFYRNQMGYTQQQVADYLCIWQRTYAHYEAGKHDPNVDTIIKLCILFNCTTDEMLEMDTQKEREKVQINNSFNNSKNIKVKIK